MAMKTTGNIQLGLESDAERPNGPTTENTTWNIGNLGCYKTNSET